jgi:hypothetical protein
VCGAFAHQCYSLSILNHLTADDNVFLVRVQDFTGAAPFGVGGVNKGFTCGECAMVRLVIGSICRGYVPIDCVVCVIRYRGDCQLGRRLAVSPAASVLSFVETVRWGEDWPCLQRPPCYRSWRLSGGAKTGRVSSGLCIIVRGDCQVGRRLAVSPAASVLSFKISIRCSCVALSCSIKILD